MMTVINPTTDIHFYKKKRKKKKINFVPYLHVYGIS